ncbi:hypothetical protein [Acetobacter sp. DsW_063]|uniref:hypothetical protein n=1 Tax=Acetobacter sp. DsW_063 TaxID=1514894 RepID=UPI000A3C742D|nr:hypothetical protein [Acetobacter sp. DsW_063]
MRTIHPRSRFVGVPIVAALFLTSSLLGCGGAQPDDTVKQQNDEYVQAMDSGQNALAIERYSVAEQQYRMATRLAVRHDDAAAIADASFNLAVTQLAAGEPENALATVREAREALSLRASSDAVTPGRGTRGKAGVTRPDTGGLNLVSAAALYRLRRYDEAARSAAQARTSSIHDVALRAAFLGGLIASDRGDIRTLAASIQTLASAPRPHTAVLKGDLAELRARASLSSSPSEAMSLAAESVASRQSTGEYRAMARALVVEAHAARAAGHNDVAASLLARAAQSVAARSDGAQAPDGLALQLSQEAAIPFALEPFDAKKMTDDITPP